MKRVFFMVLVIAIALCPAMCVSAADYEADANGFYEIVYEDEKLVDNAQYGFIVIKGLNAVLDLNDDNIDNVVLYIDQAAAADGKLSFGKIGLKDTESFEGATAFIGGGGSGATTIGNLLVPKVTTVDLKGIITDTFAGTKKLATVTVYDGETAVTTANATVENGVETFSAKVAANKTYSVVLTKAGYLDMKYTGVAVAKSDVDMGSIALNVLAGDVDESGAIIYEDLAAVISNYGKTTDNASKPEADLDGSGAIIYEDLAAIIGKYGKSNADFVRAFGN